MHRQQHICTLLLLALLAVALCRAQDYDDEGYGNQGANQGGNGAGNQGDNEGYQGNYNDDGYGNSMTNGYQQNSDPEGSNSNPNAGYSSQGGGSDADGDYDGDDSSAAASAPQATVVSRTKRSAPQEAGGVEPLDAVASAPKLRVKRHGKYYIGPVYTYVKTDKHANFKWGIKHKVGKKHYG